MLLDIEQAHTHTHWRRAIALKVHVLASSRFVWRRHGIHLHGHAQSQNDDLKIRLKIQTVWNGQKNTPHKCVLFAL